MHKTKSRYPFFATASHSELCHFKSYLPSYSTPPSASVRSWMTIVSRILCLENSSVVASAFQLSLLGSRTDNGWRDNGISMLSQRWAFASPLTFRIKKKLTPPYHRASTMFGTNSPEIGLGGLEQ